MTRRKGDVFGGLPKVSVGAKSVKLSLNQIQKEDESLASPGANPTRPARPAPSRRATRNVTSGVNLRAHARL